MSSLPKKFSTTDKFSNNFYDDLHKKDKEKGGSPAERAEDPCGLHYSVYGTMVKVSKAAMASSLVFQPPATKTVMPSVKEYCML